MCTDCRKEPHRWLYFFFFFFFQMFAYRSPMGGVGGRENTPPSLHPFRYCVSVSLRSIPPPSRQSCTTTKKKNSYFWLVVFSFDEIVPHVVLLLWCSTTQSPRPRYCHPCGGKRGGLFCPPPKSRGKFFFFSLPWRGHIIIATIPCPLCPCLIAGIKNPRDFHRNGHYNYPISSPSGSLPPPTHTDVRGFKKIPKAKLNSGLARGKIKSKTKSSF